MVIRINLINSIFVCLSGYNKFDYWTSGNRLGTDMLIWMSTGLPFNTTFNQMKRPSSDGNGLDNEELKMSTRPELPIARKKRLGTFDVICLKIIDLVTDQLLLCFITISQR